MSCSTSRRSSVVGCLIALLLGSATSVANADTAGAAPVRTEPAPVPELSWKECGTTAGATAASVQCATAELPLDYDKPEGDTVDIAVAKVPATVPGQRIGSLFFNFGGPGGPSVDYLQRSGAGIFATLNERFDIVGFDPRGVGQSSPAINCEVNQETEGLNIRPAPVPDDLDADALVDRAQAYVDRCLEKNGKILEHVSTANVARDMDALRAAVGDERLSYLGFSYGTFLGATYAALFPDRFRALVLDGPVDPDQYVNDPVEGSEEQLAAFERALDRFLEACAADQTACSGFGGSDPSTAYDALLASATETPIPAEGYTDDPRPVTADDIRDVTLVLLYTKRAWGILALALAEAASGDGSTVRALVDQVVYPRDPDGSYDPSSDRFFAISAGEQDWPDDVDAYLERGAREYEKYPHFYSGFAYAEIPLALWPIKDEDAYDGPFAIEESAPTPLVIGTTYDPATPYSGALAMTKELGNARLLTMEGDGHTAYGRNSACVNSATDAYLFEGTLPADGTVCEQEVPFAAPQRSPAQLGTGAPVGLPVDTPAAAVAGRR